MLFGILGTIALCLLTVYGVLRLRMRFEAMQIVQRTTELKQRHFSVRWEQQQYASHELEEVEMGTLRGSSMGSSMASDPGTMRSLGESETGSVKGVPRLLIESRNLQEVKGRDGSMMAAISPRHVIAAVRSGSALCAIA